ncbi:MAG TPA: cupin domain-containing protein [Anaerolineae bacterium]|nr:cupin domain-containing protein [Anaerolineae bacterium]
MIARHYTDVELEKATEAEGVSLRIVIGEKEGAPNFVMRVFDVEPGASSPRHSHDWEHEVFVLSGKGKVYGGGEEVSLSPGYTVFVPPMEEHQFSNVGDEILRFVCLIPLLEE